MLRLAQHERLHPHARRLACGGDPNGDRPPPDVARRVAKRGAPGRAPIVAVECRSATAVWTCSYSLYLWQQMFIVGSQYMVKPFPMGQWQEFPLNVVAVFAMATVSFCLIGRPVIAWGARLAKGPPAVDGRRRTCASGDVTGAKLRRQTARYWGTRAPGKCSAPSCTRCTPTQGKPPDKFGRPAATSAAHFRSSGESGASR